MSLWSRMTNVFRGERLRREIDEELQSHMAEALEHGRDPDEVRRTFGSPLSRGEESRDVKLLPWLDSLRADAVFGWRQLMKKKLVSAAAVLSLALAIGACTSAFRIIDALLLRPLPIAEPERLYALSRQGIGFAGKFQTFDGWAYPSFRQMRAAVKGNAELIAVSYAEQIDLTYGSDPEMEKAYLQYVSGWMFSSFGLRPALGRLLTENDDSKPRAHPYAVISYDYWTRRFGQDPKVIGRAFRMGNDMYEITGVIGEGFTGTETGTAVDIFVPNMMHPAVTRDDSTWIRTLVKLNLGVTVEPVRARLQATSLAFERERAKGFTGMRKESIDRFINQNYLLEPAPSGSSNLQHDYKRPLLICGVLVALVLLIACANVANLLTAQGAARAREMALRVSIGAGRGRLIQLVLVESAWLTFLAAVLGAAFSWWSAPFVVSRISPPGNPAHLALPADARVLVFGLLLTLAVTFLFGLAPALRASSVRPANALKGGLDPHSRRRLMHGLIATQVAFCFVVLFVGGLFVATFEHLSHRPLGFSSERLLTLDTVTQRAQLPLVWEQVRDRLREAPGVETVALAGWPLLTGHSWNGFVSINGAPPGPVLAHFLNVSPGWLDAMKIPLTDGRDFRASDTAPGVVIVSETFANQFFNGANCIGRTFAKGRDRYQVVGLVRDAPYRALREPTLPVAYVPFNLIDSKGASQAIREATFIVRTSGSYPLALASMLRKEAPRARPEFRVSNIRTQAELVSAQTVPERLLAMLALFFAMLAVLLAGVGLYGVLDYSVLQRRREIGIRMAIGARAGDIARGVTVEVFSMVLAGMLLGLALGIISIRYIDALLYEVSATEPRILVMPWLIITAVALLGAVPAVVRAVRIDPVTSLRAE